MRDPKTVDLTLRGAECILTCSRCGTRHLGDLSVASIRLYNGSEGVIVTDPCPDCLKEAAPDDYIGFAEGWGDASEAPCCDLCGAAECCEGGEAGYNPFYLTDAGTMDFDLEGEGELQRCCDACAEKYQTGDDHPGLAYDVAIVMTKED